MIQAHHFCSSEPGPRLALMGGIHGNEVCGPKALQPLIQDLQAGKIRLVRGSLLVIPVANPKAYAKNSRFVEENLNRVFTPHDNPRTYEQKLANTLTGLLSGCDALLDMHSIHSRGTPLHHAFWFPFRSRRKIHRGAWAAFYCTGMGRNLCRFAARDRSWSDHAHGGFHAQHRKNRRRY
jgi:predicted deacylase